MIDNVNKRMWVAWKSWIDGVLLIAILHLSDRSNINKYRLVFQALLSTDNCPYLHYQLDFISPCFLLLLFLSHSPEPRIIKVFSQENFYTTTKVDCNPQKFINCLVFMVSLKYFFSKRHHLVLCYYFWLILWLIREMYWTSGHICRTSNLWVVAKLHRKPSQHG